MSPFSPFGRVGRQWRRRQWPVADVRGSRQWLYTYGGRILAGTRAGQTGNTLYLAWTAARGSGQLAWLSQPHVELVAIDLPGITFAGQRALWNPSIAFAYPNLTRNGGELPTTRTTRGSVSPRGIETHRRGLRTLLSYRVSMCRSIKQLRGETEPTDEDIQAAALQFVRKISGFRAPSRANQEAFYRAVSAIASSSRVLLDSLETRPSTN